MGLSLQHAANVHVQAVTSIGQLDFVLELVGLGGGMQGILHFNTDLFDKATAHRMLGHYGVRSSNLHTGSCCA